MTNVNLDTIIKLIGIILTFLSLLISYSAIRLSIKARRDLSTSEQIGNIVDFFVSPYQDRKFKNGLVVEGNHISSLKEARLYLPSLIFNEDDEISKEKLSVFYSKSKLVGESWENILAYELSLGLESVGSAIIAGAIPISFVLTSNAHQIISDWLYCEPLVNDVIRINPKTPTSKRTDLDAFVSQHRMHGEWLSYASYIWLKRDWKGGVISVFEAKYGGNKKILRRERIIRRQSKSVIPKRVHHEIKRVIGVHW
jgi:hypothetical protein